MAVPKNQWKYVPDDGGKVGTTTEKVPKKKSGPFSWTVDGSIFHHKTPLWYVSLIGATVIFAAIVFLLTHDKITAGFIVLAGFILAYAAGNQPDTIKYVLDDNGLTIAQKTHPLGSFRSFFMVNELQSVSIILIPLKRFMPALTIYCEPKDAAKVTDILSDTLPLDKNREDVVDRFMRQIKF